MDMKKIKDNELLHKTYEELYTKEIEFNCGAKAKITMFEFEILDKNPIVYFTVCYGCTGSKGVNEFDYRYDTELKLLRNRSHYFPYIEPIIRDSDIELIVSKIKNFISLYLQYMGS